MEGTASLAHLDTLEGYRQSFMDPALWEPFIRQVCQVWNWPCERITLPGLAGSFPTFIVDRQKVVKFFGPLFNGETCWQVEQECGELMKRLPEIPAAKMIASGSLQGMPGWKYIVFEFIPGSSIGERFSQVSTEDKLSLAAWLGKCLRRLHELQVPEDTSLPKLDRELMSRWTADRLRHGLIGWPAHLASGMEGYLTSHAGLVDSSSSSLIHADLTRDHLIGDFEAGRWVTRAVIDFGDAMLGNLYYELAALHLDLFDCERSLLKVFLDQYGLPVDRDFVSRAMATALAHQFDVIGPLFSRHPQLKDARSLEDLAESLWNMDRV